MRWLCLLLTVTGLPLAAQTATPLSRAAETITEQDVMRRVGLIAADSMMGRGTPSPGLERAAEYVAREFQRAGLKPAGEKGTYLQRFGVTRWTIDTRRSTVELVTDGVRSVARVGTDARHVLGTIPSQPLHGSAVLLFKRDSSTTTGPDDVKDRIVLLVVDFTKPVSPALNQKIFDLARAGPKAVVILSNRDSVTFAQRLSAAARPRLTRDHEAPADEGAPVVEVHERALAPVLAAAGIQPDRLRRLERDYRRTIPSLTIELNLPRTIVARGMVPNVAGILEGSDPRLRHEYLIYSAHIDHIGISPGQGDSINNGADDNASGVAGLLELVEAFTQPGVRPKRSLLFLAPSGEEDGLLGSAHFTEHPSVPLDQVVANLNMDLVGRNWRDSVIVVGPEQSDLGTTLERVVQAHPELRMTPIADRWPEERIFYRSDHYNFARKGVPILFFTSGTHADYHRPSDEPQTLDGEKEARLVRLLFYLGAAVADQGSRPKWTPESYRQIVGRR
ncbi:MAG TPA: M20/M25/M40 family metallo-hydrolase [Gemmatimonadales bacterium]|nr:M20/M25/M40 family metallo-hydrolase [Gemmatimonadales bacterium]